MGDNVRHEQGKHTLQKRENVQRKDEVKYLGCMINEKCDYKGEIMKMTTKTVEVSTTNSDFLDSQQSPDKAQTDCSRCNGKSEIILWDGLSTTRSNRKRKLEVTQLEILGKYCR
jgi:hypothetical protein